MDLFHGELARQRSEELIAEARRAGPPRRESPSPNGPARTLAAGLRRLADRLDPMVEAVECE